MSLQIKGLPELERKLGAVAAAKFLADILRAATLRLKGRAAVYPPATNANVPGPYPKHWYQRGYGVRWARKAGGAGGRRTSERLGTQWYAMSNALRGVVGNRASYARYPKGLLSGQPLQSRAMRRLGWVSLETDVQKEVPLIEKDLQKAVDQALGG